MAASDGAARGGLAILSVAVVAVAGCTRGAEPVPEPEPPPVTVTPSTSPVEAAQEFPVTAQEYAELTVAAWAAPDLIRLGELTAPAVRDQIIGLPGPPDLSWTFVSCDEDTAESDCSFYNADGDELVLTVDHALLGEERATIATAFEATRFPDQVRPYLAAFVDAWQAGNLARMQNLAVAAAVEALVELAPPPDPDAEAEYEVGETTGGLVAIQVTVAGQQISTEVSSALLGEPHAIRTATLSTA